MKKAKRYVGFSCPDCGLTFDERGISYCMCPDGHWENAKWIKEKRKG